MYLILFLSLLAVNKLVSYFKSAAGERVVGYRYRVSEDVHGRILRQCTVRTRTQHSLQT